MDQSQASGIGMGDLLISLPATLVAILAMSFLFHRILRARSLGIAKTAGLLTVGMATGVAIMGIVQAMA